ncbi:MAG: hypothetical protein KDD55_04280 [Bdellovibrionales bacterium]|nr:hypothetical protein [Bdellovibrionales bacterium]
MRPLHLFLLTLSLLSFLQSSFAEAPEGVQSGEIELELGEEKSINSYHAVQNRTITKISNLEKSMLNLATGSKNKIDPFDDWELNYLATVYLYCTMQTGVCPRILQTIFEIDFINSVIDQKSSCPNLTRFWKKWIEGDMERRLEYKIEVGQFAKRQAFNKNARPKFVKCRNTIDLVRKKYPEGASPFKARYEEGSSQIRAVQKTLAMLEVVRKKIPNIFYKTGVKG